MLTVWTLENNDHLLKTPHKSNIRHLNTRWGLYDTCRSIRNKSVQLDTVKLCPLWKKLRKYLRSFSCTLWSLLCTRISTTLNASNKIKLMWFFCCHISLCYSNGSKVHQLCNKTQSLHWIFKLEFRRGHILTSSGPMWLHRYPIKTVHSQLMCLCPFWSIWRLLKKEILYWKD